MTRKGPPRSWTDEQIETLRKFSVDPAWTTGMTCERLHLTRGQLAGACKRYGLSFSSDRKVRSIIQSQKMREQLARGWRPITKTGPWKWGIDTQIKIEGYAERGWSAGQIALLMLGDHKKARIITNVCRYYGIELKYQKTQRAKVYARDMRGREVETWQTGS